MAKSPPRPRWNAIRLHFEPLQHQLGNRCEHPHIGIGPKAGRVNLPCPPEGTGQTGDLTTHHVVEQQCPPVDD